MHLFPPGGKLALAAALLMLLLLLLMLPRLAAARGPAGTSSPVPMNAATAESRLQPFA